MMVEKKDSRREWINWNKVDEIDKIAKEKGSLLYHNFEYNIEKGESKL